MRITSHDTNRFDYIKHLSEMQREFILQQKGRLPAEAAF